MKLITRDTDYAIRALVFIARNRECLISVADIVKCLKIPRSFLRKGLQLLTRKRILKSYKGVGGGFSLAKRPTEISLVDLIKIFQGKFSINECFFKAVLCPNRKHCLLNKKISQIEKYILKELSGITIASLLKGK